MNRLVFALALLLGGISADADAQGGPGRAQLEKFSEGLETLHARFEQRVISSDGMVEDTSSGEVWLQRPALFRWDYGGEYPERVVADGKNIWIHDEVLEQVTVKNQSDTAVDSPLMLLTDLSQLDAQFAVNELGNDDDLKLIELRPRAAESEFERILLGMGDDVLKIMIMEDAFGLRTELRFHQVERNLELDPALFSFSPPDSADVIGDIQR